MVKKCRLDFKALCLKHLSYWQLKRAIDFEMIKKKLINYIRLFIYLHNIKHLECAII